MKATLFVSLVTVYSRYLALIQEKSVLLLCIDPDQGLIKASYVAIINGLMLQQNLVFVSLNAF